MYIDSHCHLFYEDFREDLPDVIRRAEEAGVRAFVVPATDHRTAAEAVRLSERFPNLFVAVGIHPLDLQHYSDENLRTVESFIGHPKVVAVGEIGIDYFYDRSPRDVQQEAFSRQLELAANHDLPVIVHTRDSVEDAVRIATDAARRRPEWRTGGWRGVFHCFTGDAADAETLFAHRFMVSFPGPVTFKTSAMPEVLKRIGLENIMVETDAPFLTPVPFRGKRNEPMHIPLIARKIAEVLGVEPEEVERRTTANAVALFRLPIVL